MDIYFSDTSFKQVAVVDIYTSFIWTDRYNVCGDFELVMPYDGNLLSMIKPGFYVHIAYSNRTMILENISIDTDVEAGIILTLTGRSLESILDRRVIWAQNRTFTQLNLHVCMRKLLNESIIQPSISNRRIDGFTYTEPTDSRITDVLIDAQYTGDNLYDAICDLCVESDCGFKVILDDQNHFVFSLYKGVDHSFGTEENPQRENPPVVFSPEFDNIINSNSYRSITNYKTMALVMSGEKDGGTNYWWDTYQIDSTLVGLDRREVFINANDITKTKTEGDGSQSTLTQAQVLALLRNRGKEELETNYKHASAFEAEIDYNRTFVLGTDYDIGDIVQVENILGVSATARIVEVIISDDSSGFSVYPTFEIKDDLTEV